MNNREQATRLEISTIQPIPLDQRHGTAADLFTVWFGSNLMLLTIVTGGLAVTVFGLPFWWAVIGLTVGNMVGAVFMALHAAQGPTLGVPQMIQTRGQFGSLGSLLVVGIVIVMYVGFLSSNLVLGGEALTSLAPGLSDVPGIALVGVISIIAAIWGHDLIHAYARVMSYVSGAVLLADRRRGSSGCTACRRISSAATRRAYPACWARFPRPRCGRSPTRHTSPTTRATCRATPACGPRSGPATGAARSARSLPMILGAMVGLATPKGNLVAGLASLTRGIAPLVLVVFSVGVATANAMNLYCGALSTLTFGQTVFPGWLPRARARTITVLVLFGLSLAGALLGKDSFLDNYTDFILLLLYVLVPWTAINLVDYYLLRHGEYDVASFFRQDGGVYGRVNAVAVECYLIGILVQLPLVATPLYTGPLARAMGGVDLSWIVGLAVTGPGYYWLARRSMARRSVQSAPAGQMRA